MNHSMLAASFFLTCFLETQCKQTWESVLPHEVITVAVTAPVLLAEQALASFILLLYCTLLRWLQMKMRTYRQKEEEEKKISILNKKRQKQYREVKFRQVFVFFMPLFQVDPQIFICGHVEIQPFGAPVWMQYNLWCIPVGKTAQNSEPSIIWETKAKSFLSPAFFFFTHIINSLSQGLFFSALSWDVSYDCFLISSYSPSLLPPSLKQN